MDSKLYKLTMTRVTSKVILGQLVVDHQQEDLIVESTVFEDYGRHAIDMPHDGQIQASWTKLQTPFTAEKCRDTETVVCVVHAVVPWEEFKSAREEARKRKYFEDTGEEWPEARPGTPMGEARPQSPVYRG